jgi:hypothetical protein
MIANEALKAFFLGSGVNLERKNLFCKYFFEMLDFFKIILAK